MLGGGGGVAPPPEHPKIFILYLSHDNLETCNELHM